MPHPRAGQLPLPTDLIDVDRLRRQYFEDRPDPGIAAERVAFGTSGHRGSAARRSFNEAHILAVVQAVCELRAVDGPLFLGMDTHALSAPAHETALEVLVAHGVEVRRSRGDLPVATPVVSHAILTHPGVADGLIITPSHNPPEDGGIKYNPPHGGPADTDVTRRIEERANQLLGTPEAIRRVPIAEARRTAREHDFVGPYVSDLAHVVDLAAVRAAGIKIGVDPLGGANLPLWGPLAERYGLDLTVVNDSLDPTFRFMPLDHDGKIRMDCSSPYAMTGLVGMKDRFAVAFGNDADSDRHGIVTPSAGLLNPNHYLAVAIQHLFTTRDWGDARIGKTLVSSGMIDRVAASLGRTVVEVPVGFKWFVAGLHDGTLGFGGEESAGASFLRLDRRVWTTDKDGVIMGLLAAEILARTGKDPGEHYRALEARFGSSRYVRVDAPATPAQKAALKKLSPDAVRQTTLAGEPITARLTRAPGNGAEIGGLKVVTENGWFAARPSGTEDVYKIYAESFRDQAHLDRILEEAQAIVTAAVS